MKQDDGKCRTFLIHDDTVEKVRKDIPNEELLIDLADFFKIFGDTTRIRILSALFVTEMCVCDLSEVLNVGQSAMSHQLKTLRLSGLVKFRKEGKSAIYSLKDNHVKQIIDTGIAHITE